MRKYQVESDLCDTTHLFNATQEKNIPPGRETNIGTF